jgi:hypothetical protein
MLLLETHLDEGLGPRMTRKCTPHTTSLYMDIVATNTWIHFHTLVQRLGF